MTGAFGLLFATQSENGLPDKTSSSIGWREADEKGEGKTPESNQKSIDEIPVHAILGLALTAVRMRKLDHGAARDNYMGHKRCFSALPAFLATLAVTVLLGTPLIESFAQTSLRSGSGPVTGTAINYALSPPARELPSSPDVSTTTFRPSRINPLANEPDKGQRGTWKRPSVPSDLLIGRQIRPGAGTQPLDFSFEGVGNPAGCGGCSPPDTNGDVGPNHYVQMVNATKVAIFDKTGVPLALPFNLGSLWPPGNCANNAGDPVVVYDRLADRWVLSQFAFPTHMCIAVSQTADPLGSFHLYTFNVGSFPDYFKIGAWPNAYYMGANESTYTAYAFDRARMLVGDPQANFVKFTGQNNFLLPAGFDGPALPPATSSAGYFYTFKSSTFHGAGPDRIELFTLDPDFTNPALSTFTLTATLPTTPFTYTVCGFFNLNCARQPDTTRRLDVVSEWPMHRFRYRNFGDRETLVGNFTVGGGTGDVGAAIRWFELRNTGIDWTLFQEGTFDPGDGHDRFMGSIEIDRSGDIALGYSISSSLLFPAVRYATRVPSDPAGTLRPEEVLINGGGSQTGSNRWGDYSAMAVDPIDDCSFWYTNEYYPVTASTAWKTRVGVLKVPSCGPPVARANGPYKGIVGSPISFSSAGSTGAIVQYTWDFGDGSVPSNDPNPTHIYSVDGAYTATLTVADIQGAMGTDTALVTVAPDIP